MFWEIRESFYFGDNWRTPMVLILGGVGSPFPLTDETEAQGFVSDPL